MPKISVFGFYSQNLGEHRSHPEKAHPCLKWRVLDIQCVHCIEVHCIVSYLLVLVHFVYFMPILCSINVPNNYCYGYTCSYYVITISQHHDNILRRDDDGIFSRHQTGRRDIANCRFQHWALRDFCAVAEYSYFYCVVCSDLFMHHALLMSQSLRYPCVQFSVW